MFVVTTIGPENTTKTVEPFMVGIGVKERGNETDLFLMQEAAYLGSDQHVDLSTLSAPGMPTVEEALEELLDAGSLGECIVCEPCAIARNIGEDDLREWATFGGPEDLARLAEENETTMTF
ncbi:DsrE family protein [Halosolutus amylolyticus]|uniref:DsrE family protein n=1 Tax=Halosolutus amylolyticus TaxID=2932267 RepID=A0ABD5PIY5_9EURY|nr:DsrE family protein [Halosolutus amylolyticus]